MGVDFRTSVFKLCKKMASNPEAQKIRSLIHDLSVVVETADDDPNIIKRPSHGDLASLGAHQKCQFLGYLFADEAVDEINKKEPFHAIALSLEERKLIENAHNTITFFLDSCMSEIKGKYEKIAILIDPYSQYRKPKLKSSAESFLSDEDVAECVATFKSGKVYKKIVANETLRFFESIDNNLIHQLVAIQQKQFIDDLEMVTKETEDYFHKLIADSTFSLPDVLMMYLIYSYALRKSLALAVQMIFEAILGLDMPIMDNDSIFELADHKSTVVYEKLVVLTQEVLIGYAVGRVGSIALVNCDITETYHIKEFGEIIAITVNLIGEFGSSSKVAMITVDDELNPIHRYTDAIMETNLGQTPIVVPQNATGKT